MGQVLKWETIRWERRVKTHLWVTTFFFFFSFAGDYTGRPAVVMNVAVLRRSPMIPYSLLCIVVASVLKSLLGR